MMWMRGALGYGFVVMDLGLGGWLWMPKVCDLWQDVDGD